ncbi:LTA synthase family protein [Haloplasma contractile]|uniref:Arylsulfatase protein n=1 Tax=Haloplasma contractile SSD-17B TaxID=1033810 RepID=U2FJN6_9MOLU|nr:LTA synthase family protein [Haloplasma contractile]ERJ13020.1 Arylsulfatase protein [Haloplasma contractile SSD-17B]
MKKSSNIFKRLISIIANSLTDTVEYISEDHVIKVYLIFSIIPHLILKIYTEMYFSTLRSFFYNSFWVLSILGVAYFIKNKKIRNAALIFFLFISYALVFTNIMYYKWYESFTSLSLISQLGQLDDVSDGAAAILRPFDVIYWLIFITGIILLSVYAINSKKEYSATTLKKIRTAFLRTGLSMLIIGLCTLSGKQVSRLYKLWNRPYVVENYGIYTYHMSDLFKSVGMLRTQDVSETDYERFIQFVRNQNKEHTTNGMTNKFKGKNVIVIHAESVEQFLVNRTIDDQEITPYLNQFASEGYYFSNMYSQESVGTSSDTEFTFNTSLLPVNNGTIFLTHFNNNYVTTPKLLKEEGYFTMSMHGNNGSFWNRDIMHPSLGYDILLDRDFYHAEPEDLVGFGINDYKFYMQSIEYLKASNEPYYATLITLTNHTPFADVDKYTTYDEEGMPEPELTCGELESTSITCNYLKSAHYADWAFGQFLLKLEESRMLDETIVVLYGDHPANLPIDDMEVLIGHEMDRIEYKARQKVPFIIWSKDIKAPRTIDSPMGMVDAAPTIQNMLGIHNLFSLGNDMFNVNDNLVVFNNGDWTDGNIYYDDFRDDYYITNDEIDESVITEEYIEKRKKEASNVIDISNIINKYDIIEYYYDLKDKVKI